MVKAGCAQDSVTSLCLIGAGQLRLGHTQDVWDNKARKHNCVPEGHSGRARGWATARAAAAGPQLGSPRTRGWTTSPWAICTTATDK
eukprot:1161859-Pelagomonas_calceolata.AAC.25